MPVSTMEAFPLRKVTTASELSNTLGLHTMKKNKIAISKRTINTPIQSSIEKFS
ncbi:hypothetical protein LEP1GSC056_0325 [Leptospira borgpetersenii str. Brem 328]|uniref:Uncharacterized protein n=1 Tax=Leptospira borgpetersenii str. Brem 328 TaxID=1049780 RepID=A0ABC9SJF3_LEPBO|nr:hypothetical protein LEP1GSC056_0325 [Leptospira borgpetersenii str. Brem 328]